MKEKPIIFSGPMVRAILEGRKTVTRRVIKPQPIGWLSINYSTNPPTCYNDRARPIQMPYAVGERLWVRESLHKDNLPQDQENGRSYCRYSADARPVIPIEGGVGVLPAWQWKRNNLPAIHMPRRMARLFLKVTGLQPACLQDMTTDDARAEGVETLAEFRALWDKLNAKRGYLWDSNPWVWVVEFKRIADATKGSDQ